MERRFEKIMKNNTWNWIISIAVITFSAFVYSIGVVLFVSEAKLLASGVSGMSLIIGSLIEETGIVSYTEAQISGVFYFILNLPILFLSFRNFSLKFSILSILHMALTSLFTAVLNVNALMDIVGLSAGWQLDYQLESALFSGVMCGFATAVCYLVGGSSAGIDLLAAYFSYKKSLSVGTINGFVNACIIILSVIIWTDGIKNALFTLAFIYVNATVIDMIFVANKKVVVTIITEKGDEISDLINSNFTRGVTRMKAMGNYTKREKDFLYIACTSNEALEISRLAREIDEHSFTSISNTRRISGYFINKKIK